MNIESKYLIVESTNTNELKRLVDRYIYINWVPVGGPFIFDGKLCQALVRKDVMK